MTADWDLAGATTGVRRLRPAHTPEQLRAIYAEPHRHGRWPDHRVRVGMTVALAMAMMPRVGPASVADLSCGDGAIASMLTLDSDATTRVELGDLAYAPNYQHVGPIERTIDELEPVDLFVCCETLEHVDAPAALLAKIRPKASRLLLSTPVDAWTDGNPEHYWAWDRFGVETLLGAAGFRVVAFMELDLRQHTPGSYAFGVWWCV